MKRLLPILVVATGCSLDVNDPDEPPRPPDAVDVTMQFCDQPVALFAYKNEGYDWVVRTSNFGIVELTFPAREKVTVVTGFGLQDLSFALSRVTVRNMTAAEADAFKCRLTPLGLSTMSGLVQTPSTNDLTIVQFGDAVDFIQGTRAFTMSRLGAGMLDLVALNIVASGDASIEPRVIVRSNITVANNTSIPALDFGGTEGKLLSSIRVRHDGGVPSTGFVQFETSHKTRVPLVFGLPVNEGDSLELPVMPAAFIKSGDLHRVDIHAPDRGLTFWQPIPKDTTITLGPGIGALTFDTIAAPEAVLRPRVRFASQSAYPAMAEVRFQQSSSAALRSIEVITTAGFLGGTPAEWELTIPELRGIIPETWILRTGVATTTHLVTVRDARPALYHGVESPAAGETMRWATKSGQ